MALPRTRQSFLFEEPMMGDFNLGMGADAFRNLGMSSLAGIQSEGLMGLSGANTTVANPIVAQNLMDQAVAKNVEPMVPYREPIFVQDTFVPTNRVIQNLDAVTKLVTPEVPTRPTTRTVVDPDFSVFDRSVETATELAPVIKQPRDEFKDIARRPEDEVPFSITLDQLYDQVLGRRPDTGGEKFWRDEFGGIIDDSEIERFKQAAAPELKAKELFQTYVTGFDPGQEGIDFWRQKLAAPGATYESVLQEFLNPQDPNAPRRAMMLKDPDYLAKVPQGNAQDVKNQSTSVQGTTNPDAAAQADAQKAKIIELAKTNPDAEIFKKNPALLAIYTPLSGTKEGTAGQYGYVYGVPILNAAVADELLGGNVVIGAERELQHGQGVAKELGADPNSTYAGRLATGAGIFGVTGKTSDFARYGDIENRIVKAGGLSTQMDSEGNGVQGIYEEDKRTGERRFIPYSELFETGEAPSEGGMQSTAASEYQKYTNNREKLVAAAEKLGIDASKYPDIKSLYDAVNNSPKIKNVYMWQGRTAGWDPTAASNLGVETTDINKRGVVNHAQILYRKEGDKLVPVIDPKTGKPIASSFKFDDPNTSRGFVGDILSDIGAILSIPPIAMAFAAAGGLQGLLTGNLGVGAGYGAGSAQFADAMAKSWLNPATIGSALNVGDILGKSGESLLGQSAINTGLGALSAGLQGADLEQALTAGLASGVGTGTAGLTSLALGDLGKTALGQFGSQLVGGAAGSAIMGRDVEEYIQNQILSKGLGALTGMAGKEIDGLIGPEATRALSNLMPLIQTKQLTPGQAIGLAISMGKLASTTGKTPPGSP